MLQKILLLTAPFTQLNTPYPATAYLKGFLNTQNYDSYQVDLGIELILQLFTKDGISVVFENIKSSNLNLSENAQRIVQLSNDYISTIEPIIRFLQNKNNTLAHRIITRDYLPEASRFMTIGELDIAFGTMGILDKAKYFATLYLEDLGDLITECIDPYFGFSRYAEHLGMSASSFDDLYESLNEEHSLLDDILIQLLNEKLVDYNPTLICISIPFPGNLYASLRCGQYIKSKHPNIKIVLGGGYPNTELRSITDQRIFEFCDFISLDDGEAPLKILLEQLGSNKKNMISKNKISNFDMILKRTFILENNLVVYKNNSEELDIPQREVGIPDYSDLWLEEYLSVIEFPNPMHRLWSDGRWNKLTLAHGCYWGKCTFCDVNLDYIGRYEPIDASILCDRIEHIIEQTGENGFHFVDEAAPPALLRDLSIEIIRRNLSVVWWTNIRFEKSFNADLCKLMASSGCIAISAGLEVASDRLLKLIKKGVSIEQVSKVSQYFTDANIMVHAYLMYGFPTQSDQETIDSLEMVRQLYKAEIIQSSYWHRFALTTHSPISSNPEEYNVQITGPDFKGFAVNDLTFENPDAGSHDKFGPGLRKALYNYMHNNMIENPVSEWFDFETPITTIDSNHIYDCIKSNPQKVNKNSIIIWIGNKPTISVNNHNTSLTINNKSKSIEINTKEELIWWLKENLEKMHISNKQYSKYESFMTSYENEFILNRSSLINSETWHKLRNNGLLIF